MNRICAGSPRPGAVAAVVLGLMLTAGSAAGAPGGPGGPAQTGGAERSPARGPGAAVIRRLAFDLTCGAYMNLVISYVALVNHGPGTVPAGTRVHWSMSVQPGPDRSGDYVFAAPLAPNGHVWMNGALPLVAFTTGPCTVTVQ